jgi:hypothetical protein
MAQEYRLPAEMCDLHREEMHDLIESGEFRYMQERVQEWRDQERQECEYCLKGIELVKEWKAKGYKI